MKYIRRGEEGVRASDIGPSENQAIAKPVKPSPFVRPKDSIFPLRVQHILFILFKTQH